MFKEEKFYFTFGSDEKYPFQGGWVEVIATDKEEAICTFQSRYPNRAGSPFYNACDCYDSSYFENTKMYEYGNLGSKCHNLIYSKDIFGEVAIVLPKEEYNKLKMLVDEAQYRTGKAVDGLLKKAHLHYDDDEENGYCLLRWWHICWTECDVAVKFIKDFLKNIEYKDYDYLAIRYQTDETESHYGTGNDWLNISRSIEVNEWGD